MKPVTRTELRRFLGGLSQAELLAEVVELWATFPPVQDFYQAKLRPASDDTVREKYRRIVQHEFYPSRGFGKARLAVARKAVADYKKVAGSVEGVADLMLFYVETGVRFTNDYGDIEEAFYLSMERMYASALKWIRQHGLEAGFEERCARIVTDTRDIGWGFHDALSDLYAETFGPPEP